MPKKKKQREVFDQNHYRARMLFADKKFVEKVQWLKDKFTELSCPVPIEGFKTPQEYFDWNKKYWNVYAQMRKSKEYREKIFKITEGKERYSFEQAQQIEAFEDEFLPPVYGEYLENVLEEFGINKSSKGFKDLLDSHIFFGKNIFPTGIFTIKWIRNKDTDKMELFIQIFGHTRREDINEYWPEILKDQKLLPDYKERNKEWETFGRDNEIYNLYLNLKANRKTRAKTTHGEVAIDSEIWLQLSEKYPKLTMVIVRNAINKMKRFLESSKQAS